MPGVSRSSSKLATLALLRGRRTCDHNHFRSLSPTFFSKEINILLFLCILVFSHSSSPVLSDAPGCGRGALLGSGTESRPNGSLPLPRISDHALAGQQVVRRDEGTPHDFLGGPKPPCHLHFIRNHPTSSFSPFSDPGAWSLPPPPPCSPG